MVVVVVTSFRQVAGWGVGFRGVTSEYPKKDVFGPPSNLARQLFF